MCMSPQARDRWWYIVPISICVVLLHSDFSIFVHLLLDNVTYASCNVWCPTCSWLARKTSSLLVETKELCYTYFGNLVSLYRQTSSDFHEVLLATIVNKYSLLEVVWIYQPSWEAQAAMNTEKETASRTHQHSKDKSNTSLVLWAYQTILHLLVLILHFTETGVLWLRAYWRCQLVQAFDKYRYGRTIGMATYVHTSIQRKLYWHVL